MEIKELRGKPVKDLEELLRSGREELRELRFRIHRGEEKGVRRIRVLRKQIAEVLTVLNQKK